MEWLVQDQAVLIRDSKDPQGGVLRLTHAEWAAFVAGVKDGQADLPAGVPDQRLPD